MKITDERMDELIKRARTAAFEGPECAHGTVFSNVLTQLITNERADMFWPNMATATGVETMRAVQPEGEPE